MSLAQEDIPKTEFLGFLLEIIDHGRILSESLLESGVLSMGDDIAWHTFLKVSTLGYLGFDAQYLHSSSTNFSI